MNSIYGEHLPEMNAIADEISRMLENGNYEHIRRRIKSEESMRNKCRLNHLPENERSALELKRCADELASCDISMQVLRKRSGRAL